MAYDRSLIAARYRLREPVGVGGMGRVWLARDEMLSRDVAIKEVVPPEWLTPSERGQLRERTLREARTAAQLNHPNVVKIYDVVQSEQWPWIVMEYIASRSLQQVIKQDGPLSPARTATIGLAILDALRSAHQAGVLHRDVKPHNVLIGEGGRVVLTDFGLATLDTDGAITRGELIMGSPQYIAPERARDGVSSQQADMWSLGATLYTAVEGRSPYARSSPMATLTALATDPPDPVRRAGPLAPVLAGLLQREPLQRPAPDDVAAALRQVAAGAPVTGTPVTGTPAAATPRPPRTPRPARRRVLVGVAVALAGLGGAVVLAATLSDRGSVPGSSPGSLPGSLPGSSRGAPGQSPPAASLDATDVRRCDRPPEVTTPVPAGVAGPPDTTSGSVPLAPMSGWSWFRDDVAAFFIAVPPGWSSYRVGQTVCFLDPFGFRVLGVDPSRPPAGDHVDAAAEEARLLVANGRLPGYELVALEPHAFAAMGAAWEFSFDGEDGRRHATSYFVPAPTRTYAVFWVTPEAEWQTSLTWSRGMIASFRPA